MIQLEKQISGKKLTVKASGKIDTITAPEYGMQINDYIDDFDIDSLILDFNDITYISSIGLRVVLELKKRFSTAGQMKIVNVKPPVFEIFEMTGFSKILTIEASEN